MPRGSKANEQADNIIEGESVDIERYDRSASTNNPESAIQPVVAGELVKGGPAMSTLGAWLAQRATLTDVDTWEAMERAVAKILDGESAEDVLKKDLPISGKTFLNRPFLIHGFTVTQSDYEEGSPFYANLDVTTNAGADRRVLNVGGIKVLAKLMKLDELGEWPVAAMLTGDQTKRGFVVLDLVQPEIG